MIGSSPSFTVSDFVGVFNQSVSMAYPEISIVGELSNFRISKGAWVYFDLKDEYASVKFFGSVRSLPGPLEDGMMLEVLGRPNLHPQFGFSINFNFIIVVGEGSINKAQKMLYKKLESEGLFDDSRKRILPYAPDSVAIISSRESAGYGDFIKISHKRWPSLKTKLFNVGVQGISAIEEIVTAVESVGLSNSYEALVVVRGGGSKDDLSVFDNERVVRAIASCRIPTLVAIGHERDLSIAELVADVRASTPSNAAEILLPDVNDEKKLIKKYKDFIDFSLDNMLETNKKDLKAYKLKIDESVQAKINSYVEYLKSSKSLVNALDPKTPLKRGYILARKNGEVIKASGVAKKSREFELEFIDGKIKVGVLES